MNIKFPQSNNYFKYYVKAKYKIECRSAKNTDDILENYNFLEYIEDVPVLCSKISPNTFPHLPFERTKYSNTEYIKALSDHSYNELYDLIEYVLYESSTNFMIFNGIPTLEDLNFWRINIQTRNDFSEQERLNLLSLIDGYILT